MFLTIADVLDPDQIAVIQNELSLLRWDTGTKTAGQVAQAVKRNEQADLSSRAGKRLRDRLTQAIQTHPVLLAAAQPARFSDCLISQTREGGGYGTHIDNPFMGFGDRSLRSDLSYTLFLNDPGDYGGGALCVDGVDSTRTFKPQAGTLILYPTRHLHRVETVTQGQRLACVGWIESRVKREADREIIFDLENLAATLNQSLGAQSAECLTLAKIIANLKRTLS